MSYILNGEFATTEDSTTTAKVSELYDAFTYSNGVYTATLWKPATSWTSAYKYTVSVSVKGGYVVGVSTEYTDGEEEEGFSTGTTFKYVYNFSNYGSTTVKASDAAKKAVEDYKNED